MIMIKLWFLEIKIAKKRNMEEISRYSLYKEIIDISKQTTSFLDEILEHKVVKDAVASAFDEYLNSEYYRKILEFESNSSQSFMQTLLHHCIENSNDEQLKSIKMEMDRFYQHQKAMKKSIKADYEIKLMKTKKSKNSKNWSPY